MSGELTVRLLEEQDFPAYEGFLRQRREASLYHAPAWHSLLQRSFGYDVFVLSASRAGDLVGALPLAFVNTIVGGKRLVSLPFSHRVHLLADDAAVAGALLDAATQRARESGCRFVEVRGGSDIALPVQWSKSTDYVTSEMPLLASEEEQLAQLRSNTRNQLRQGLRSGDLRVETRDDSDGFATFEHLVALTRRRKGSPTYPKVFFEELRTNLVPRGAARLELAFSGTRCIAGFVTMSFGKHAIYGYSGSVDSKEDMRRRPINVLMWRGMSWARRQGAEVFDLGTSLATQQGLIHFKEGWGAVTGPMISWTWSRSVGAGRTISQEGGVAGLASAVLKRTPLGMFRRLSPLLLKQVG